MNDFIEAMRRDEVAFLDWVPTYLEANPEAMKAAQASCTEAEGYAWLDRLRVKYAEREAA